MGDLVQWLRAQLDEDERTARAASDGPWKPGVRSGLDIVEGDGWSVCNASDVDVAHIARHDPARVLREIDAKRLLLADHAIAPETYPRPTAGGPHFPFGCGNCHVEHDTGEVHGFGYCLIWKALALPYAARPGYREEWRP